MSLPAEHEGRDINGMEMGQPSHRGKDYSHSLCLISKGVNYIFLH